jgi:hypothetical protein
MLDVYYAGDKLSVCPQAAQAMVLYRLYERYDYSRYMGRKIP